MGYHPRLDETFLKLFKEAGFRVIRAEVQKGVPETPATKLYPIKMYALKPGPLQG
jgi:protein N-terminal methyltransferase